MITVHITATPITDRGMIHLDLSTSGTGTGGIIIFRRTVGSTVEEPVILPAAWFDPDGSMRPITGQASFDDAMAPLDVAVEYLASVGTAAATVVSSQVTLTNPTGWWLGDPLRPYLNLALTMHKDMVPCAGARAIFMLRIGDEDRGARSILTKQSQRADELHTTLPMELPSSTITLASKELSDRQAISDLLDPGDVLLLRAPGTAGYGFVSRFCSITKATEDHLTADGRRAWRKWGMSYQIVLQPPGGAYGTAGTTWDSLCASGALTFTAAAAAGISWRSIADGIPGGVYPVTYRTWAMVSATWATWAALTATGKTWQQVVSGA